MYDRNKDTEESFTSDHGKASERVQTSRVQILNYDLRSAVMINE